MSRDRAQGRRGTSGPGKIERVGDLVGDLLQRLGIEEEIAGQGVLLRWDKAVGEGIAAVARARAVSRGTLFVEVASSSWMSELNMMRREILSRLNAGQDEGRVERIVFTLAERSDRMHEQGEEGGGTG